MENGKAQSSGRLLCPCTNDSAHQDKSGKRIELIDGEERSGTHFVHVSGECDGADEADPQEDANGGTAADGVGIAPNADLREGIGNQNIQKKADDVGKDGIHAPGLSFGHAFESHPRIGE